jgi:UDP-N-acetylmuramoyl-tripeptide--D-alanyl-D-alanine ligase
MEHAAVGRLATDIGIDHLVVVGAEEFLADLDLKSSGGESAVHYFESKEQALSMVEHFEPGDVLLVKASRSEEFDLLAQAIKERLSEVAE